MTKIGLGMSGGVDSSVAAYLLSNQGYNVIGITLTLCGVSHQNEKDIKDAKRICDKLNIMHVNPDFSFDFKKHIIGEFINEYICGNTPNPCITCNKIIKFGKMLEYASNVLYCEKIATGHYARITKQNDRFLLTKAVDRSKDQSYMLYKLSQEQLSKSIFPLGEYTKSQIREIAQNAGFITADRPDSQDICFVPDGDYAGFIEKHAESISPHGNFIGTEGELLGEHNGIIHYTVGQRKGLGIALGAPAYVISKNAKNNTVTLSTDEKELFYKYVEISNANIIAADKIEAPLRVNAKLRYRHTEQPATLHPTDKDSFIIEFDAPQRAPAPGQAAVFYDGDTVIGGGTIVKGVK